MTDGARRGCVVVGCARAHLALGLCRLHWDRLYNRRPLSADHDEVGLRESGYGVWGIVLRDEDSILCYECGRLMGALTVHLPRTHGMTPAEYRHAHGLARSAALVSESVSRALGAPARARMADPVQRERWVEQSRRVAQPRATEAARGVAAGVGGVAARADGRTRQAGERGRTQVERECQVCGVLMVLSGGQRRRVTCSRECQSVLMVRTRRARE